MRARVLLGAFLLSACGISFAQGVVAGAGYAVPFPPLTAAPGQLLTFFVTGLGPIPQTFHAVGVPIGNTLGGITAVVTQFPPSLVPVPIFAIEPLSTCGEQTGEGCGTVAAITVQVSIEIQSESDEPRGTIVPPLQLVLSGPGSASARVYLSPVADQIHVLGTCDTVRQQRLGLCRPLVTHADGTLVTAEAPAKSGEELVIYAVGLGGTQPYVPTGHAAETAAPTTTAPMVQFDFHPNASPSRPVRANSQPAVYAGLVPNSVGLYQVNVIIPEVPAKTNACLPTEFGYVGIATNVTVNIARAMSFDGAGLCVQVEP